MTVSGRRARSVGSVRSDLGNGRVGRGKRCNEHVELPLDSLQTRPEQGTALRAAFVQNDAWDTAQASRIHGLQTAYVDVFLASAVMTMYQGENSGRQSASRAIVQDMIGIERQLLDAYDALLDRVDPTPSDR